MNQTYIERLNSIFQSLRHNQHSDFYRQHFNSLPEDFSIKTFADFERVPTVSKAELQVVSAYDRALTPAQEFELVRNTSGTTGRSFTLFRNIPFYHHKVWFDIVPPTGFLHLSDPSYLYEAMYRDHADVPSVQLQYDCLETTVKLAQGLPINHLATFAFSLDRLIPLLQKYDFADKIQLCNLWGERVDAHHYEYVKANLPNALITFEYSMMEGQGMLAYSIDEFDPEHGVVYTIMTHDFKGPYLEIVNPETGQAIQEPGVAGEIALTTLNYEHNPTVMFRYRTGDMASYVVYDTDIAKRRFTIHGRIDVDRILLPGGQLLAQALSIAMRPYNDIVLYELHYTTKHPFSASSFELWLQPKTKASIDVDHIAQELMQQLRVSPRASYADLVARGTCPSIKGRSVDTLSRIGAKRRLIVEDKE
ncbi:MAG: hypothetical protein R3B69_02400 [Candidatus Paceibacterota bacterium]